jgi:hypothetical protein
MIAKTASPSDPLFTAGGMMRLTGALAMCAGTLFALLGTIGGLATRMAQPILFGWVVGTVPFFIGFVIQSSAAAMTGRYTWAACRRAAFLALPLGPLGFVTGVYTLAKLYERPIRDSFNS